MKKLYLDKDWKLLKKNADLYLLILPAAVLTFCFAYIPMYGILIAFQDYRAALGIMDSPWADPLFRHFTRFFNSHMFVTVVRNTLTLSFYTLFVMIPLPIILALFINQMRRRAFKRVFQTVTYMPHFISTVVMVGMVLIMLSPSMGLIGNIFGLFGAEAPNLMGSVAAFPHIYVWSEAWQHTGWDSIIYLAALSAVDPTLYEAATIDGASRWQRLRKIDLPMLLPTACVLLILRAGNIMNVGFEKVFLMQNNLNLPASEIISTYVYQIGIVSAQYSYSAAINLFNTMVNLVLLLTVNFFSRKMSGNSLW